MSGATSEFERPRSPFIPRVLRVVRRTHMYLGLLLMPWVLLFGVTALSFNHPTVGRGLEGQMIPPPKLKELTGFEGWRPEVIARDVLNRLDTDGAHYDLEGDSARFSGWPLFASDAPGGKEVIILGIDRGMAILTKRDEPQQSAAAPFTGKTVDLPAYRLTQLAEQLQPLHPKLGIETSGPLRPHPKIHPELRFVARDHKGTTWNVVYNLSTQEIDGRKSSEARHAPFVELLESLHTQHHYPASFGPTFFWALFADLTALTLVFWAMSGLFMWWQMKKFRLLGSLFLGSAVILASLVMISTSRDLTFGPERESEP